MSTLVQQSMKVFCPVEGHEKTPIGMLCFSDSCKQHRSICYKCVKSHVDHIDQCFDIDEISKLIDSTSMAFQQKENTTESQIQACFKKFKSSIIQKLNEVENLIEQNIKKLSNGSFIMDIAYQLLTKDSLNASDFDQLVPKLRDLVEINNNKLTIKNTQDILVNFKNSLEYVCTLKQDSIYKDIERVRQIVANDQIQIRRLQYNDPNESWVYSNKSLTTITFSIINKTPVWLTGLYQPKLKQQDQSVKITYRLHEGRNLTKNLMEMEQQIKDSKMEIVEDCYLINIPGIKLESGKEYTISAQGSEKFYSCCYQDSAKANEYIQFQSEILTNSPSYTKPTHIEDIQSLRNTGAFPCLQISEREQ